MNIIKNKSLLTLSFILSISFLIGCAQTLKPTVQKDFEKQVLGADRAIKLCYQHALKKDRHQQGKATVYIEAEPKTGRFTNAHLLDLDIMDNELAGCIVATLSQLKLDHPTEKEVAVKIPIIFRTKE